MEKATSVWRHCRRHMCMIRSLKLKFYSCTAAITALKIERCQDLYKGIYLYAGAPIELETRNVPLNSHVTVLILDVSARF